MGKMSKPKKARKLKDFSEGNKTTRNIITVCSILFGFLIWSLLASIPSIGTFLASPRQVWKALLSESSAGGRYWKDWGRHSGREGGARKHSLFRYQGRGGFPGTAGQ